jgi:universal stress protein E
MQQPKNILVVLDKPKHAQTALERAIGLASASGAHLHLAAFCWLPMAEQADVFDTHQRRAIRKSVVLERRRWLDALVLDRGLAAADLSTEVVWTKDIAGWVAENTPRLAADLLVKSVHHSRTLLHTPLDWQLLRQVEMPMLLVSTEGARRAGNVLATIDLRNSDAKHRRMNRKVLAAAAELARLQHGKLHCVNVVEMPGAFQDVDHFDSRKVRKQATDNARSDLEEMLAPYDLPRSRMHLPSGKVGQVVADVADKVGADVVVVGTGARRGLGLVLLGSSAEKILTRVHCDVLAVHV